MTSSPSNPTSTSKRPGDEVAPGTAQSGEAVCPACAGTGHSEHQPCPKCGGTGTITQLVGDA